MNHYTFIILITLLLSPLVAFAEGVNLIPVAPATAPNYWCTWDSQRQAAMLQTKEEKLKKFGNLGDYGSSMRHSLDEQMLFDRPGVLVHGFEEIRSELWVVLDDGWDVPYQMPKNITVNDKTFQNPNFGRIEPDPEKFSSFKGNPGERLKALNEKVKSLGWRGLGLWIACTPPGNPDYDLEKWKDYYRQHLLWCHEAGVGLWKVDWGARYNDLEYRKMLTDLAHEVAPGLIVEHAEVQGAFFDEKRETHALKLLGFSDLFRTYDVAMMTPTTAARCSMLLQSPPSTGQGVLNVESDILLAAGLGCTVGIMQHPLWDAYVEKSLTRLIHWQRLAPPYGVSQGKLLTSEHVNIDLKSCKDPLKDWFFASATKTNSITEDKKYYTQKAPAVIARGLPLPKVNCDGEWPFVFANRNPNGCIAVSTEGRQLGELGQVWPLADVTVDVGSGDKSIGVFGRFKSLTLKLNKPLGKRTVWAQDLTGDHAEDITNQIISGDKQITLPIELLKNIGLSASKYKNTESCGMVLVIR
jgi:hypothetical protein